MADITLWASSLIAAARHGFKNQTPINSKESVVETREHPHREAWNKGRLVGQKAPLKPKDICAIRIHLQNAHEVRDLAMFNLAIDSKLRGCDLVSLRVRDVTHGNQVLSRAMVVQQQRPVQFELTEPTRTAVAAWIAKAALRSEDFLFPSRLDQSPHVSTRQYARIVEHWVVAAGLDPSAYRPTTPTTDSPDGGRPNGKHPANPSCRFAQALTVGCQRCGNSFGILL